MDNILEEASALVECKECPWYKACVMPMRFDAEDVKRQLMAAMPDMQWGSLPQAGDMGLSRLLAEMAAAAQSVLLEGCPIFIRRLRASPELARRLKELMQNWGKDEAEPASPD